MTARKARKILPASERRDKKRGGMRSAQEPPGLPPLSSRSFRREAFIPSSPMHRVRVDGRTIIRGFNVHVRTDRKGVEDDWKKSANTCPGLRVVRGFPERETCLRRVRSLQ